MKEIGSFNGITIMLKNPEALPIAKKKWNKILAEILINSYEDDDNYVCKEA